MQQTEAWLLTAEDVVAGYGKKPVLNGVGGEVAPGEIVGLIGHNGADKSMSLKGRIWSLALGRVSLT